MFSTTQLPHTSDGGVQIPRMGAFYKAIKDGHIPVRWAGDLNYGFGLPLFNFIYHTPFYISSVLLYAGLELIPAFKLVLLLSFILSGIGMYLFASSFSQSKRTALLVTMLYQFAPYHLVEIFVRGSVGGIYAYAFFPFVLYFIVKTWNRPTLGTIAGIAVFGGVMILSHNALALLFFGCIALFILFFHPSIKGILLSGLGLLGSLGIACYYWLPALLEHKYTYGDLFMKDLYRTHFPSFLHFFIPNLTNSQSLRVAEINVHIGLVHTIVMVTSIYVVLQWLTKQKHTKAAVLSRLQTNSISMTKEQRLTLSIIMYSLILLGISFFFMSPISLPLWERVSFLRQFQFPWRFLGIVVFSSSFLGFAMKKSVLKNNVLYVFILIGILIPTMFYWRSTQGYTYGATNEYFWEYPLNTTYFGETDLIWSAGPASGYPVSRIEVIEGNAEILDFHKKTHRQTFKAISDQGAKIMSNTQFFPGWKVYINKIETEIQFQDPNHRGLITFTVPPGNNHVEIQFQESGVRVAADIITLCSLGVVLLAFTFPIIKHHIKKQ